MLNTIQLVFLRETHVFVSISRLFRKIEASKIYPRFKMLIFHYKTRFFTKFSTFLGFFQALNTNLPLFFVLDLGVMVKNGLQRTDLNFLPISLPQQRYPLKLKLDNSIGFEFSIAKNPQVSKMIEKQKLAQTYCRLKHTCINKGQMLKFKKGQLLKGKC